MKGFLALVCFYGILVCSADIFATDAADDLAQANNPIANIIAVSLHDYYIGEFTGQDEDGNQFWLRYAQPFSLGSTNWIMRVSLPVNSYPFGDNFSTESGIGDLNILAAYLFDVGNPAVSFGIGPLLNAPTASEDVLGAEKWSAGFANVYFNGASKKIQYGYLLTWQGSFAGEDNRDDVNLAAVQYFAFYQLGGGWYLRSTPVWAYNFNNDTYSVPLGLGFGKVIPTETVIMNVFVEPQISVADDGDTWPEWQIFAGFNMQFKI